MLTLPTQKIEIISPTALSTPAVPTNHSGPRQSRNLHSRRARHRPQSAAKRLCGRRPAATTTTTTTTMLWELCRAHQRKRKGRSTIRGMGRSTGTPAPRWIRLRSLMEVALSRRRRSLRWLRRHRRLRVDLCPFNPIDPHDSWMEEFSSSGYVICEGCEG